jgi:hypothetical protein
MTKRKLAILATIAVIGFGGWHWFCQVDEAQWQESFRRINGEFGSGKLDDFHFKVTPDQQEPDKWQVTVWTPGDFAHWYCRGFKTNREAAAIGSEMIESIRTATSWQTNGSAMNERTANITTSDHRVARSSPVGCILNINDLRIHWVT